MKKWVLLGLIAVFCSSRIYCDEAGVSDKVKTDNQQPPFKEIKEESSITTHTLKINGSEIKYTATAGTMVLKDERGGEPKASIFYVSYIKDGVQDKSQRPITYCFNGGPGSSSVWLHMGMMGPKRVVLNQAMTITQPPNKYVDNDYSILDLTDLVFIDPVSTGYSRAAPGQDPKQFHGVEEDIKSVGEFIRLITTRYARWDSPKFLAGESYGTTRAAGLANHLFDENNLCFNGIILISSILDFQTIRFDDGNDLPYILFLPSYTSTAWYHKKLEPELQKDLGKTLAEAEAFALNEYALALLQGDALDEKKREQVVGKLARYTGLSPEFISDSNLRVCMQRFAKELLRSDKRAVGRFDSRYLGINSDVCGYSYKYDAFMADVFGAFMATFMEYARKDLKWEKDSDYKILTNVQPWNFGDNATNAYLNVVDDLNQVMSKNTLLKVYVASGYFDLATPYFSTVYTFRHLGLDPSLKNNIKMSYFDGGHMMYTELSVLQKLKKDLAAFYNETLKQ